MPYRLQGKTVQVKKGGKWVNLKTHPTVKKALAHLYALRKNVKDR